MNKDQAVKYQRILKDPRWGRKREEILKINSYQCKICGNTKTLQVHHTQYHFSKRLKSFKKPWDYNQKYLIVLCSECHSLGHEQYKVPIKKIN